MIEFWGVLVVWNLGVLCVCLVLRVLVGSVCMSVCVVMLVSLVCVGMGKLVVMC